MPDPVIPGAPDPNVILEDRDKVTEDSVVVVNEDTGDPVEEVRFRSLGRKVTGVASEDGLTPVRCAVDGTPRLGGNARAGSDCVRRPRGRLAVMKGKRVSKNEC
jgi:hypothetical protein